MRISDWSSDVCSSDLSGTALLPGGTRHGSTRADRSYQSRMRAANSCRVSMVSEVWTLTPRLWHGGAHGESRERRDARPQGEGEDGGEEKGARARSEEHTTELQSLMRSTYAVICLKKQTKYKKHK